ncbi:hypothetical protein Tco_1134205 [Tanacetum coccineum]
MAEEIEKLVEEEEELAKDDYELKRREKRKHVEETRHTPSPTTIRSPRIQSTLPGRFRRYKSFFQELQGRYGYLFEHILTKFMPRRKFNALARHLQYIMMKSLPKMVDERIKKILQTQVPSQVDSSARSYMSGHLQHDDLPIWLALKYKFETLHMATTPCRPSAVLPTDQDNPYDAHLEGEKCTKRLKTSEHRTFVFRESSSGQDYESEPGPSTSGNHDQYDDFDFWINSYVSNDDVLPNEKVSQELMDEMSQTVDEAKLRKVVDEMLRQQCTSGDEHQYHIDQMQNFLKSDIVWESKKEIIVPPYQLKPTLVVHSCQRDPKAPALSLVNQDLLYLKKGNKGPEKIAISPYTSFPHVCACDYIRHEHKFITEIVAKRANGCIVSITESDYKNLNKNDIEDMYLLIINHKVYDYAETGLLWSLSVFIRSTVIWERVHDFQLDIEKYKMFSIVSKPVYGIIYKNSKEEKKVMRHQEVHKFCDATLKRVLEGLKSYNNDVKYGYVTHNLSKEDVEYLQVFAEEIEERLKYRDQMRRWEMEKINEFTNTGLTQLEKQPPDILTHTQALGTLEALDNVRIRYASGYNVPSIGAPTSIFVLPFGGVLASEGE